MKNLLFFVIVGLLLYFFLRPMKREETSFKQTMKKAAIPDQMEVKDIADLENSKMVSEGSQFGVQYVNELIYDD